MSMDAPLRCSARARGGSAQPPIEKKQTKEGMTHVRTMLISSQIRIKINGDAGSNDCVHAQ